MRMERFPSERRVLIPHAIGGVPLRPGFVDAAVQTLSGITMGTTWSIRCLADARAGERHRDAVVHLLSDLVADLSNWEADSALSRFNRAPLDRWLPLPASLVEVLDGAARVFTRSRGAFDPGVGALVARWGFGPSGTTPIDDDESSLARVELDVVNRRARKSGPVALDLCGIAKGYAVDRVSQLLDARGAPHHLVEIGGELRGNGVKADATPWWVALERPPVAPDDAQETFVALHGLSIATSGDYRRRASRDGITYSHTIDPFTRAPLANGVCAVTVVDTDCMFADAHATAMMVLGRERGLAYAHEAKLATIVHVRGDDARLESHTSPAFDALVA